ADPETARRSGMGRAPLRLPIWPCSAWGLPCPLRCRRGGALLPHRFTLTVRARKRSEGGFFSVALSFASPRPGVTRHAARYGVRTFLPDYSGRSRGPLEPGLLYQCGWRTDYSRFL